MFSVGDKVVYPMHGAARVEAIEERIYDDKPAQYLVLSMFLGNMKVRVPLCNSEKVGLRPVIPKNKMKEIQKVLKTEVVNNLKSITWNRRFTIYLDKMKTGDVLDLAEVISILARQDKQKRLSTGERRLLGNARQILASEIMIVKDSSIESAEKWIDKALNIA
ncbi:MAG: CarD family transcriptional regulator [Acidaminococcaceae bacterium]|jgi:CarD family transcriptional regulator|nr:CarD family transcriptional regulator [Acidaminococcaceae bacterium]MBO6182485.1 CarD family transcriptional regulator [Acidaminococcaceae bacterium]MBO6265403.1 CarD family transcriptional regulator [Acidaminococcaceae bacterium]MBP3264753.1 CarD family transcriptional regulator [Acidaminococcaceae bacterium]MBQ5343909.1 CarD family transcriptional regulator [Acidaminococcaceae bacterium]